MGFGALAEFQTELSSAWYTHVLHLFFLDFIDQQAHPMSYLPFHLKTSFRLRCALMHDQLDGHSSREKVINICGLFMVRSQTIQVSKKRNDGRGLQMSVMSWFFQVSRQNDPLWPQLLPWMSGWYGAGSLDLSGMQNRAAATSWTAGTKFLLGTKCGEFYWVKKENLYCAWLAQETS